MAGATTESYRCGNDPVKGKSVTVRMLDKLSKPDRGKLMHDGIAKFGIVNCIDLVIPGAAAIYGIYYFTWLAFSEYAKIGLGGLICPLSFIYMILYFTVRFLDLPYRIEIIDRKLVRCTTLFSVYDVPQEQIKKISLLIWRVPIGFITCLNGKRIWLYRDLAGLPELIAELQTIRPFLKVEKTLFV
jgi:hypothetical protein